jgi:alpha-tubulin suppressor-like RCC1 family protein
MKRLIIICSVVVFLAILLFWLVMPRPDPSRFEVGKPLPPGKVTPQLVSSWDTAVLLAPDGSLWAWGGSEFSMNGVLETPQATAIPVRIGKESDWRSVSASWMHVIALKDDGSLWGWGWNSSGQLGQGNLTKRFVKPVRIGTDTNWIQVSAGAGHALALKNDGSLWAWGQNDKGQAGNGTTSNQLSPAMIGAGPGWKSIAAGAFNSYALKTDGTIWGWGLNPGSGGSNYVVPVQLDSGTNWVAMSAGDYTLLVLKSDGTLWIHGQNAHLSAEKYVKGSVAKFARIGGDTNWQEVFAGQSCFFARRQDGSWWGCGSSEHGELGIARLSPRPGSPLRRLPFDFEPWAFAPGYGNVALLTKDGTLWSWGQRLGTGSRRVDSDWRMILNRVLSFLHFKLGRVGGGAIEDSSPHRIWVLPSATRRSLIANAPAQSQSASNAPAGKETPR